MIKFRQTKPYIFMTKEFMNSVMRDSLGPDSEWEVDQVNFHFDLIS